MSQIHRNTLYVKSLAKLTQDFIPVSKFDSDQVNRSLGTMKGLSVSIPKTG